MTRKWTTLGLAAALAAALAAGRAGAQPGDPPKADDPRQELEQFRADTIRSFQAAKKDIDALREEVGRLRKDLDELRDARPPASGVRVEPPAAAEVAPGGAPPAARKDVDALKEQVALLRQALDEVRKSRDGISRYGPAGDDLQAARKEVEDLKDQAAQLRKALDSLRGPRPPESRASNYGPLGDAPTSGTGSIVLLNTYPADVTIVVDGEGYTLAPGERRVLAGRPAGGFTYEVVGVQPPVQRTLAAGGAFPIHVHP